MDTESQTATKQLTYKVRYPILWRLIIFFIALCSTIIVLICAVFVFVNTQIGRNYIADKIEQTTDGHIRIQGLSGFSPSDLTIAQIQFNNDAVGVWAEVKEVQLKWSPLALLSNEISIRSLVAKEIDFYNLPPKPEKTDNNITQTEHRFADLPYQVNIQHLQIDHFFISEQIAKRNISISVDGKVKIRNLSKIMNIDTLKETFMAHPKLRLLAVKQPADFQFGGKISGSVENKDGKEYNAPFLPLHFSIMLPEYPKPNSNNELKIYLGLGEEI